MVTETVCQGAIKFNGGGHVNHSLFWENLAPKGKGGGEQPSGALGKAIDAKVGIYYDEMHSQY